MIIIGIFSKGWNEKELEEANKYCETITVDGQEKFDIEIANRIKAGKKIKHIQITHVSVACYKATFIYDYNPFEEKLAKEKESNDLGR